MKSNQSGIWDLKLVGYLFLAGLGSGALGVASGLDLWTNGITRELTETGAWISFLCVGMGALLLLWDLGIPQRAFLLLGNLKSLISVGTIIITVLLLLSAMIMAESIFSLNIIRGFNRLFMFITVISALATAIYVGLLLAVVKCRPFWNTPLLPMLFATSSLSTGISALKLVNSLSGWISVPTTAADIMSSGEFVLLAIELLMVTFYIFTMANSLPQARLGVLRLVTGNLAKVFWIGVIVTGLLFPLIIMAGDNFNSSLLSSLMVLIGGFFLRYCFLYAGARRLIPGEDEQAAFVL